MALPDYRPPELMLDPKITNFESDDFIGIWKNFVPRTICDKLIEHTETILNRGSYFLPGSIGEGYDEEEYAYNSSMFYGGDMNRKDFAFLLNYSNKKLVMEVNSCLNCCLKHYFYNYQSLKHTSLLSTDIKVQKTPPGGGYHMWHYESPLQEYAQRELVWMIYLNDMPDGEAETEFMYQRRRIKPTAGTVVIWPAGFTHTHKGNTVLTQDKYILTGWYIKQK